MDVSAWGTVDESAAGDGLRGYLGSRDDNGLIVLADGRVLLEPPSAGELLTIG